MRPSPLAFFLLMAVALPVIAAPTATPWTVQLEASRLGFVASWEGEPFEGSFERWTADIHFDADRLDQSRFDVTIDMGSADTRSAERDQELLKPDWFAVKRFPQARFVTDEIRRTGPDRYEAVGTLTIKDLGQPVVLPFTWRQTGEEAAMAGEVVLDRTRWKVGEGEWTDASVIQHEVRVVVDLELVRAAP